MSSTPQPPGNTPWIQSGGMPSPIFLQYMLGLDAVRAIGAAVTASLGADLAISNSSYTDGPSVAQGSSGTWWVSGTVTVLDTGNAVTFDVKLWDGTTLISSCRFVTTGAGLMNSVTISGFLANPAGNLRISVKSNAAGATSTYKFNASGNSKDCTISAVRIA